MDGIQVYALWLSPRRKGENNMRKIGAVHATFNDANLIVGLYPSLLRDLGIDAEVEFFAMQGTTMLEFTPDGWKEVD